MEFYFVNDIHADSHIKRQSKIGSFNIASYKALLEKTCLPADVLVIGGDIANDHIAITSTLVAATKLYSKVIYVFGNHDYAVFTEDNCQLTAEKLDKIQKYVATNTSKKKETIHRLNYSQTEVEGIRLCGGIGMYDFDWAKQKFDVDDKHFEFLWKTWFDGVRWRIPMKSLHDYVVSEKTKLENCIDDKQDIIVTHMVPSIAGVDPKYEDDIFTGFFNFNSILMEKKLKDGAIWHYGHTHTNSKKDVKLSNGNTITLINNSIGYKGELDLSKVNKSDFRINF